MNFRDYLKTNIVFLDGSTGTLLQRNGLKSDEGSETWNIKHPEIVTNIQKAYYDAGSNVVVSNTFGASAYKYTDTAELEKLICAACDNLARARDESSGNQEKFMALDLGPIGSLLEPFGDVAFEEAVEIFAKAVRAGVKCGPDLIWIETMSDVYESKAAVIAAKENSDLPICVSHTFGKNGRIMTGADPETIVAIMEGLGVDALGMNCSFGPQAMAPIAEAFVKHASIPVSVKPNAGLPRQENGKTVYDIDEETFASIVTDMVRGGARLIGGCCGTTPEHIKALVRAAEGLRPIDSVGKMAQGKTAGFNLEPDAEMITAPNNRKAKVIASFSQTGTPEEAEILTTDNNADPADLAEIVQEEQESANDLFGLKSPDPLALDLAMRAFNGKPLVDTSLLIKGDENDYARLEQIFQSVKKYGGVLSIPSTSDQPDSAVPANGAVSEEKISELCNKYGIKQSNIIFQTKK